MNPVKTALLAASLLSSVILIVLDNAGVFPLTLGDFFFFSAILFLFALYRPGWSFLFFVGSLPFEIVNLAPVEIGLMLRPYQWIGIVTIAAVATRFLSGRLPFSLPKVHRLDVALIVFWIGSLIAVLGAPDRSVGLKQSLVALSFLILYALTRIFVRTVGDVGNIVIFFLGSELVVSAYAIWQNVMFSRGIPAFEVMPGRPNGVLTEADWLGSFLLLGIGVAYALFFSWRNTKEYSVTRTFVVWVLSVPMFVGLILSVARSAWLATAAMTLIVGAMVLVDGSFRYLKRWKWREAFVFSGYALTSFVASLALVLVLHLTTFELGNRAQSTASGLQAITVACNEEVVLPETIRSVDELSSYGCRHIDLEEKDAAYAEGEIVKEVYRDDPNVNVRREIYSKTLHVIREHFLLGVGFGSGSVFLGNDERGAGLNSSNIFLEVWLGSGLIGLVAFLYLWLSIGAVAARRSYAFSDDSETRAVYGFIFSTWIALTVFNMFNAGVFLGFFWAWLAIAAGFTQRNNYLK